jgi:hypothetical protein
MWLKMAVFGVVALCNLMKVCQRFRGTCYLQHQGDGSEQLLGCFDSKRFRYLAAVLMMEAASTSQTSVNLNQTARRNNPDDKHLRTRRHEKFA